MRYDLVIFDCDGVLVDTEPVACRVLAEWLTTHGIPHTQEEAMARFMGRTSSSFRAELEEARGEPLPETFFKDIEAAQLTEFERELAAVEGIAKVLDELAHPVCVASSSSLHKVRRVLELTGLLDYFGENVFSAQQVGRGKPFPDVFLFAAEQMGVPRERCVVVEDQPVGVEAAVAAGMDVLAYTWYWPAERFEAMGAEPISSIREVTEKLVKQ